MQQQFGPFQGRIEFGHPFARRTAEWQFFYRDVFTMFLRWTKPIMLIDGTASRDQRLMRRKVMGRWQYRRLNEAEAAYLDVIENGTHC